MSGLLNNYFFAVRISELNYGSIVFPSAVTICCWDKVVYGALVAPANYEYSVYLEDVAISYWFYFQGIRPWLNG